MILVGQIWVAKPRRRESAVHGQRYLKIEHVGRSHVEARSAYARFLNDKDPEWGKGRLVRIAKKRLRRPAYFLRAIDEAFARGHEDASLGKNDPPYLRVRQFKSLFDAYKAGQAFWHKKKGAVA